MIDLKKDEISWKPSGNPKVLWVSFTAFTLGFGIWAMFSALGPFLIKWYGYTPTQTLFYQPCPLFLRPVSASHWAYGLIDMEVEKYSQLRSLSFLLL